MTQYVYGKNVVKQLLQDVYKRQVMRIHVKNLIIICTAISILIK